MVVRFAERNLFAACL